MHYDKGYKPICVICHTRSDEAWTTVGEFSEPAHERCAEGQRAANCDRQETAE